MQSFTHFHCHRVWKTLILCFSILTLGCTTRAPLLPLSPESYPQFIDDDSVVSLKRALQTHQNYLKDLPADHTFKNSPENKLRSHHLHSLKLFQELMVQAESPSQLNDLIKKNFVVYQAGGRPTHSPGEMLVTGYYEPLLEGSLNHSPPFTYPLYAPPDSLVMQKDLHSGRMVKGRLDASGALVPYWTRKEIETQGHAKGHELVYLKDPFEAFILHVQGSGKIQLQDGTLRSIHYANDNGQEYKSIGKLLVDEKKMKLKDASIPTIQAYLQKHPEDQQRVFHHNSKYIFFKWEKDDGPFGSLGKPLTSGRSIAIDAKVLPMHMIGFLKTRRPVIDAQGTITGWQQLNRFVLPQDTGSAIQGPGRVDIFWGNGQEAEKSAGVMKEEGRLYFLTAKESCPKP